jgi:hypothetical protein
MTTSLILYALLLPLLVLCGVLLWVTESKKDRARRWRRAGMTQRAIADRLCVSRSTVRRWIAT